MSINNNWSKIFQNNLQQAIKKIIKWVVSTFNKSSNFPPKIPSIAKKAICFVAVIFDRNSLSVLIALLVELISVRLIIQQKINEKKYKELFTSSLNAIFRLVFAICFALLVFSYRRQVTLQKLNMDKPNETVEKSLQD